MAQNSNISWTEATWNCLAGCSEISPGCTWCYAAIMAHRLAAMGQRKYMGTTRKLDNGKVVWTGKINLDEEALSIPLKRSKPTMYFVNSMSDLFHDDVPDEFIDRVFSVMAMCPQHTFQVLTKRAGRLEKYFAGYRKSGVAPSLKTRFKDMPDGGVLIAPLGNVWLGISVEDQQRADERLPLLARTPAAIRFVSFEPLLEDLDVRRFLDSIQWAIIGGESGPNRRIVNYGAIRSLWHQCRVAGVPTFVKQDSGPKPGMQGRIEDEVWATKDFPAAREAVRQ